jgi:hypothetical protein
VTFEDTGDVFDPTAPDPTCSPQGTPLALTLQSPVFQPATIAPGGVDLGTGEYPTDLFQRANFYRETASKQAVNPNYGVTLKAVEESPIDISVEPSAGESADIGCNRFGLIDPGSWDLTGTALNLTSLIRPDVVPVFLLYNIGFFLNGDPNDCCDLGYHAAVANPRYHNALQTYIVADYDTSGLFNGNADITALSDEVGDWVDDPTLKNQTPSWGDVGKIAGCVNVLEAGDPLVGTDFPVTMPNGDTYHPQDLAFTSWFYRNRPSSGANRWYSFNGTFRSPALACPTRR